MAIRASVEGLPEPGHAILRVSETLELEDLGGPNGTFVRQTAPPGPRITSMRSTSSSIRSSVSQITLPKSGL